LEGEIELNKATELRARLPFDILDSGNIELV